jgi:hypothetical protein
MPLVIIVTDTLVLEPSAGSTCYIGLVRLWCPLFAAHCLEGFADSHCFASQQCNITTQPSQLTTAPTFLILLLQDGPKSGNWQSIPFLCRHGGQWPHPDVHLLVPDIITPNGLVYRDRQEPVNWFRCYHRRKCAVLPPVPVRVGCWSVDFLHVSAGLWLGLQDSRRVLSRQQNFSVSCAWHSAERHNSNGG